MGSASEGGATLASVLEDIESIDEDLILFTHGEGPVTCDTAVILVEDEEAAPPTARYLLEVFLVKDVLKVWRLGRAGAVPAPEDRCAAVVHYAAHDAYLPVSSPPPAPAADAPAQIGPYAVSRPR